MKSGSGVSFLGSGWVGWVLARVVTLLSWSSRLGFFVPERLRVLPPSGPLSEDLPFLILSSEC